MKHRLPVAHVVVVAWASVAAACSAPSTVADTPAPPAAEASPAAPPPPAAEAQPPAEAAPPAEASVTAAAAEATPAAQAEPAAEPAAAPPPEDQPPKPVERPADIRFTSSPAEQLIADGVQFLGDNNLADAQQRLINGTKQDPKSSTVWYNLALCQFRMGQNDDAVASAKQAIELNPTFSRAAVLLSVIYMRRGETGLAVQVISESLAKRPGDVMLLSARARAQVADGDFKGGLATSIEALRLDQTNPEAMRTMAEAYLGLGRDGLARLALDRAYAIYMDELDANDASLGALAGKKRYEVRMGQGGGSWRGVGAEALARDAGLAHIYYVYGKLAMKEAQAGSLDDWQTAREQFKKAVNYRPDYAEAWNNLGICWIVAGKGEEGVEALTKALEILPNFVEARVNLGSAWRTSRDPEKASKARAAYESALKLDPKRSDVLFNLGILYLENKMADVASDEVRFQKSLEYLTAYKEARGSALEANDPVDKHIADAKQFLGQETNKRVSAEKANREAEEERKKKEEEDKKKAEEDAKKAEEAARQAEIDARKKAEEEEAKEAQRKADEERKQQEELRKAAETPGSGETPAPSPGEPAPAPAPSEPTPAPSEPGPAPPPSEPAPPPSAPAPAPPPAEEPQKKPDEPAPAPPPAEEPPPPPPPPSGDEPPPP